MGDNVILEKDWKGQLGYKDASGNVWLIGTEPFEFVAVNTDGVVLREATIEGLMDEIDEAPEWIKAEPSSPIQTEQLDRGAFPMCPTCLSPDPAAKPVFDDGKELAFICLDPWHNG